MSKARAYIAIMETGGFNNGVIEYVIGLLQQTTKFSVLTILGKS